MMAQLRGNFACAFPLILTPPITHHEPLEACDTESSALDGPVGLYRRRARSLFDQGLLPKIVTYRHGHMHQRIPSDFSPTGVERCNEHVSCLSGLGVHLFLRFCLVLFGCMHMLSCFVFRETVALRLKPTWARAQ